MRAWVQIYFIPLNCEFWNRQRKKPTSMFSHYYLIKQQLLRPLPSSHVQTLFNEVITTHSKHMKKVLLLSVLKSVFFMDSFKIWLEKPSSCHSEALKKKRNTLLSLWKLKIQNSRTLLCPLPLPLPPPPPRRRPPPRAVGKSALKGKYWPLYPCK